MAAFEYHMWRTEAVAYFGAARNTIGGPLRVIAVECDNEGTCKPHKAPQLVGDATSLRGAEELTNHAGYMNLRRAGWIAIRGQDFFISVVDHDDQSRPVTRFDARRQRTLLQRIPLDLDIPSPYRPHGR
jgi:hypothetical protein